MTDERENGAGNDNKPLSSKTSRRLLPREKHRPPVKTGRTDAVFAERGYYRSITFLILWVFICIFFSQLLFALTFVLIPGNLLDQAVWSTVYTALSYSLSLFLILYLPHKFPHRWPLCMLILSILILIYYSISLISTFFHFLPSFNNPFDLIGNTFSTFWNNLTFMGHLGLVIIIFSTIFSAIILHHQSRIPHTPKGKISRQSPPSKTSATQSSETPTHQPPKTPVLQSPETSLDSLSHTTREQLGLKGLPTWADLGLAPVGYIASLILGALIVALFSFFPWFNLNEAQDVGFNSVYSNFDRLVTFIALVIIAPIAEEIIFRGWLYGKLRSLLNLPLAIAIVSALFALMHGQLNVGLTVFAMSIILCLSREITGTIYSGIIMHMIKNGVAFVLLYVVHVF